jgi:3-methyladenine DNA glycosylase AlkD
MPALPDRGLMLQLARALRAHADASRAPAMQAYMKSAMPFLGVGAPVLYSVCRDVFREHPLATRPAFIATVKALWDEATYREERYAAVVLTGVRAYDPWQRLPLLPLYRRLVVSGAWWDLVDPIATQRLPVLLARDPAGMSARIRAWARGSDIWLRRSAILCQVKRKGQTDRRLLYDCLEPSLDHRAFFVRKAMGWALREYAKVDPAEVQRYVRTHADRLSGLSVREALKHL